MNNLIPFLQKYKMPLVLVALLFVLMLTYLVPAATEKISQQNAAPKPTSRPTSLDIVPGTTTVNDLVNTYGPPLSEKPKTNSVTISEFKSLSPTRNHTALTSNLDGTVILFKEIITAQNDVSANILSSKLGEEEVVLYGDLSESQINLYTYPSKGSAYLGSKINGTVFEVWYFSPTNYKSFKNQLASDYSETFEYEPELFIPDN
jgi:hypothetical protein